MLVNFPLTHTRVSPASFSSAVPPLWVEVLGERRPLSAGRPYDIKCQVIGARPPALVTWRLDDKKLSTHGEKVSKGVFLQHEEEDHEAIKRILSPAPMLLLRMRQN